MNLCYALATILVLGVTTVSASASSVHTRINPEPYAWIQSDGKVVVWNLPEENVVEIVEAAAMLLNDPDYVVVTNYVIYSDSEYLSDRIVYIAGASVEDIQAEELRLEVERFYSWEQPLYQTTL